MLMATDPYGLHSVGYANVRRADVRVSAQIRSALEGCRSIVNVGAGAGSYEPADLDVIAVEPSWSMLSQRPTATAPVVQACAERLPLRDGAVDGALAVLTLHHWRNKGQGLRECLRVARRRVVLLTFDPVAGADFWLTRDYFPEIHEWDKRQFPTLDLLQHWLGPLSSAAVPIPADCTDGFLAAYWRRPWAYLDSRVRAGMSTFAKISRLEEGLLQLRADLESGAWERSHGHLLSLGTLDAGYRLIVAECDGLLETATAAR